MLQTYMHGNDCNNTLQGRNSLNKCVDYLMTLGDEDYDKCLYLKHERKACRKCFAFEGIIEIYCVQRITF